MGKEKARAVAGFFVQGVAASSISRLGFLPRHLSRHPADCGRILSILLCSNSAHTRGHTGTFPDKDSLLHRPRWFSDDARRETIPPRGQTMDSEVEIGS
jgi:hypothetical protein